MIKFKTTTVSGHGRGKGLGFPTVNMVIPDTMSLTLQQGVYAARAEAKNQKYGGALYYGPAPTFKQKELALEIYLFDTIDFNVVDGTEIEIEIVKFIRPVMTFGLPDLLINQMEKDVGEIHNVLKS